MKTLKRMMSAALAVLLLVCLLAVPASAAPGPHTVTINATSTGHTYEAYQIFAGAISINNGNKILSSIEWGDGVKADNASRADMLTDIKAISYMDGSTLQTPFSSVTDAQSVATALAKFTSNGTVVDQFAAVVGKYLTDVDSSIARSTVVSGTTYQITGLAAGYYLIKDQDDSVPSDEDDDNMLYTKYLLSVVGDSTVTVKGSHPTLTKKVADVADGTYGDATDVLLNDTVYFELIGTIPNNFAEYNSTYYYQFNDHASDAITIDPDTVKVYRKIHNISGLTEVTGYTKNYNTSTNDLTITFTDLKAAKVKETNADITWGLSDTVVVRYTAKLDAAKTSSLVIGGLGNLNAADLTYSNDPNEVNATTGTTSSDEVAVYTYQLKVKKVSTEGTPLQGAIFHVMRKTVSPEQFAQVDANGYFTGWTTDEAQAASFTSGLDGYFTLKGIDEGSYWLREHQAPSGYNKLTGDVNLIIASSFHPVNTTELETLTIQMGDGTVASGTPSDGSVEISVENKSGETLPETGGMGTTIFYVVGIVLVAGAATVLFAKKRTGRN